ncbi:MAG: cardiolipin synthase B [Chitinivibrionales bacterium]|nr:cardiolipin synthase B [Chitinivibrionales bacterium]
MAIPSPSKIASGVRSRVSGDGRPGTRRRPHMRALLESALGYPFTDGNRVDVLRNGQEIFPAMLTAIREAQLSIEFLTFIYWRGDIARRFAYALAEKALEGVDVFVLLDGYGAAKIDKDLVGLMQGAGVRVQWFRPVRPPYLSSGNHRTHRKIMVVDSKVAFTGGVGIGTEWEGDARSPDEYRDTHFRVRGPAVRHLRAAFLGNWFETGASLIDLERHVVGHDRPGAAAVQVVRSTASIGWNDTATLLQVILTYARKRIWIATGYFVVDDGTQNRLAAAARRGVDVRVMFPGRYHDKRVSQWAGEHELLPLLDSGVSAYWYQKTMLHAKVMIIDDTFASVGSTNLNQRSLRKDDEVSLAIDDRATNQTLTRHYEDDLGACERVEKRGWRRRGPLRRLKEIVSLPLHQHA